MDPSFLRVCIGRIAKSLYRTVDDGISDLSRSVFVRSTSPAHQLNDLSVWSGLFEQELFLLVIDAAKLRTSFTMCRAVILISGRVCWR